MLEKIKQQFVNKQFLTFVVIGIINTFVGTLFSILYSNILQPNLAFIFGYITGTIVSYILNSIFTFKENLNIKKYFKFFISVIPNFLIQNICVLIFFNVLKFNKMIAFVIAAIIGIPVTFLILKLYTFKKTKRKK